MYSDSQRKSLPKVFTVVMTSLTVCLMSCNKTSFTPDQNSSLSNPVLFENTYKSASSEVQYIQSNSEENQTKLTFQIENAVGLLQDLLKTEIRITENGLPVTDFALNKNSVTNVTTADIVFAVDVTGSMAPTIEAAKQKLIAFVKNTRAQGYHTRMCLSTFGDYTIKKCTRFYDNDPKVASTEVEVAELISEITKLKSLKGPSDPGGKDLDENPMRAVIDAAGAPWGSDSQRFLILVTDAGFLYSPNNQGAMGTTAPYYKEVTAAITQSQMKIFAVTPTLAGYDKPFGNPAAPGIVAQSQGEWYKYADLVSGKITLNTVLNKILSSINTTFSVDYVLTSQSALDPAKPLAQRNIVLEVLNSSLGTVKGLLITSNLPNGRVPDQRRFVIADKKIKANRLLVYVNGLLQNGGYTLIDGKQIEFVKAQKANAKIRIVYQYESVKDSISLTPIHLSVGEDKVGLLKFTINGIPVDEKYYETIGIDMNTSSVVLTDDVFGSADPFKISATGEMTILIKIK
jgi:von Willebrand factor type A domain